MRTEASLPSLVPGVNPVYVVTREVAEDDREGHFLRFMEARTVDQGRSAPGLALTSARRRSRARRWTAVTGTAPDSATTLSQMA